MTDLRKCKLTHKGLEYTGPVSKTAGGIRCQFWETTNPIHKPAEGIEDTNFPDGTKKAARNFCRNPTGQEDGPWCYSMDANLREDFCDVPLCIFTECRLSGPGVEYGGKVKKAGSDVECEDWDDEDRPVLFPNTKFPDESRRYARSRCRNPDGDPGGPWCFIENEDTEKEEKNYCDIPFCDDQGLKLWEPSMWSGAKVYLALSAIASPATGEQLSKWGAGIEITIGNTGSGLSAGSKDKDDDAELTPTPGIISGSKWSWFWLSWGGGFITLGKEGTIKPITIDEYVEENNILGLNPGSFQYYSIAGTGVLWSLPFCEKVTDCEVETTTQVDFPRLWPMKRSPTGYDVPVFVRATQSAFVELRPAPSISYPNIKTAKDGEIKVRISLSTLGDHLFLYWTKDIGTQTVLEVKHSAIRSARWFGLASWDTTAHWTMFCRPDEGHQPPEAMTPECAISQAEVGYHGTQWVTDTGRACIPWTDERIPENLREDKLYIDRSRVNTRNYCRNLDHDPQGPFCYVVVNNEVHRQYCRPRKCRTSEECTVLTRGSGTGRPIYILPQWRKTGLHFWLKEWDPDHSDGIVFILRPLEGVHYYKLTIGAENNEKVLFTYGDGKDENLLKEKALPHLIPIGKWGGFWLKILQGEVLLGYEGVDNPLFQWTSTKPEETFKPMLLTYTSLIDYSDGSRGPLADPEKVQQRPMC
uniref:Kringle domain-containing protein n=1 Tax=Timema cristinae TaxID=61476 RepID=A0A7R9CWV2_TIMCR|nr:unnamed protein product [Timema cristinae]